VFPNFGMNPSADGTKFSRFYPCPQGEFVRGSVWFMIGVASYVLSATNQRS
jgi:hypothetical protein